MLKKISENKNVTAVFNYAGPKQSQHKEYEAFFETKTLNDKNMPLFSNNNFYKLLHFVIFLQHIIRKYMNKA